MFCIFCIVRLELFSFESSPMSVRSFCSADGRDADENEGSMLAGRCGTGVAASWSPPCYTSLLTRFSSIRTRDPTRKQDKYSLGNSPLRSLSYIFFLSLFIRGIILIRHTSNMWRWLDVLYSCYCYIPHALSALQNK